MPDARAKERANTENHILEAETSRKKAETSLKTAEEYLAKATEQLEIARLAAAPLAPAEATAGKHF